MLMRIAGVLIMVLLLGSCGGSVPDNENVVTVVPYPAKIVCLGGDWTIGAGLTPEQAYPALLAKALGGEVKVVNAGIKGESVRGASARIDWILQQRLSTLLLAYGWEAEQAGLPLSEQVQAWETLLGKIRNANPALEILVLDTGCSYRPGPWPPAVAEVMHKYKVRMLKVVLSPATEKPELWQADGSLPSMAGQQWLAERLLEEIAVNTEQSGS